MVLVVVLEVVDVRVDVDEMDVVVDVRVVAVAVVVVIVELGARVGGIEGENVGVNDGRDVGGRVGCTCIMMETE